MSDYQSPKPPRAASPVTLLFALLALLLAPAAASAQAVTGSLPVRVTGPNGVAIPGAAVKVANAEMNFERTLTTDAEGLATFVGLTPGTYAVTVTAADFETQTIERVAVSVSRRSELPVVLQRSAVEPFTRIPGPGPVERLDPLTDLPNINNDLTPLLQVVPGAAAASPAALGRVVTDGKGKEQQTLRLDGLDVTPLTDLPSGDPALGVLDSLTKTNVALNSTKTVTHAGVLSFEPPGGSDQNYALSPMYAPGTGTLLEGISLTGYHGKDQKAGQWKFQLFEALRNDALNAAQRFDFEGKNGLRRNQFGGKIGGPLFGRGAALFLGYEGIRARSERVVYEAVPADALCLCGGPVGPFLGGFLPPGTTLVPGAADDANYLVARRRVRASGDGNAWDARLDLTGVTGRARDTLNLRFTRQAAEFLVPDGVTGRRQRQGVVLAHGLARLGLKAKSYDHNFQFGFNQTRSHAFVETLPGADPRLAQSLITVGSSAPVSNLPGDPATVPVAALGGMLRGGGRGFDQSPVSFNASYDMVATFEGRHRIEAGFEARFIRLDFDRFGGLTYSFADVAALRSGTAGVVNFLSDLSGPSPFGGRAGERRAEQRYYLSHFQGRSIFSPRLMLTYGVRYDYFGAPRERDDRAVVVDPESGTLLPPGTPFYRVSKNNFQPRVGLAYQLRDNLVLRAGAGVYSGVPRIGDLLLPIESDRFNTGRAGGAFPLTPAEVVREFVDNPDARQFQPLSFARDFTTPERVYRWDVMLTRTFGKVNDLNILYSGNLGRDLQVAGVANQIVSVQTNADPTRPAVVRREFDIVRGDLLFKPFGELLYRASKGSSSYNGLTVQFKRNNVSLGTSERWLDWQNFTSFNAQYTLGRNVGNASGAVASDTRDFDADFGFNAADVRHSFSLSTGYRLWDDAHGRPRRDIIWGWTIAPTFTVRSGTPLAVRLDRPDVVYVDAAGDVFGSPAVGRQAVLNTPGGGATGGARVPDLVPGVNPYLRRDLQLLNPEAFAVPAPGRFGNLRRGELRGPGFFQVDLALTRVLFNEPQLFNERGIAAELKIEFTNLLNRTNFVNPSATLPNVLGMSAAGDRIQPGVPFTRLTAGQTFGVINAAESGRQIQFTVTFKFNDGF